MCGLFGWLEKRGKTLKARKTLARTLCAFNDERGGDSWGFHGDKTGRPVKGLSHSFWMGRQAASLLAAQSWCIGHTRKATTGKVTVKNSHPFKVGAVVGAHNGMVMNHAELNEAYGRECEVDSEHIFRHLDEGLGFQDIKAYGAIAFWVDRWPEDVFLGRFNSGQLALYETREAFVWSSDEDHLMKSLSLSGIRGKKVRTHPDSLYAVTPDRAYMTKSVLDFDSPWAEREFDMGLMRLTS